MNERIKELVRESNLDMYGLGKERHRWEYTVEKFAELIVRECISIAQDRAAFDWAPPYDVNHIIDEIKEHFGVEE